MQSVGANGCKKKTCRFCYLHWLQSVIFRVGIISLFSFLDGEKSIQLSDATTYFADSALGIIFHQSILNIKHLQEFEINQNTDCDWNH